MRPVLVIVIWLLIIGGVWSYIEQRDNRIVANNAATYQPLQKTDGDFALEITPTFGVEADPFALQSDDRNNTTMLVRLRGEDIYNSNDPVARGETVRITPIDNLVIGGNELYIEASPPVTESHISHALRVRLLRSETTVLDETLWAEAGSKISGSLQFTLSEQKEERHDDH